MKHAQPAMPKGAEEGIRKGIYKFETVTGQGKGKGSVIRFRVNFTSCS